MLAERMAAASGTCDPFAPLGARQEELLSLVQGIRQKYGGNLTPVELKVRLNERLEPKIHP
jgi:hypothetical protein